MALTIKEVAQAAGVSTATVSRVLNKNGYVSETVRRHVERIVRELNYEPNALARSLKQERTRTVGMVLPDMTNPYFMAIARVAQQRLMEQGYRFIYMDTDDDAGKEREALGLLMGMRIEGLLVAGTGANADLLRHWMQSGIAVVLIDRTVEGLSADMAVEDNAGAACEGMSYLLERFGADAGVIAGPRRISTAREREEGVRKAYARFGIEPDEAHWFSGEYDRVSGVAASRYFFRQSDPPRAFFCFNNELTYGFYLGMKALDIPLDAVDVVSFGALDAAPLFGNRLSVIRQHPVQIGEAAVHMMLSGLDGKRPGREKRVFSPGFEPADEAL